ncbi:hypothetical protein [Paludisphaera rhizosphaerae]|uniref:hypothetical protein n=1 Tax=Paludisphaera rhizosphaerae TaxID=2711216 RepID=UPI0013EA7D13|nr:hypothetical protein [Paludisphaera rhizosphaerae]
MSDIPLDEPAVPLDPPPEPDFTRAPEAVAAAAAEPVVPSAVDLHVKLGPLQDPGVSRPRAAQVWAWALAGGGLAGLASWTIGEFLLNWFVPDSQLAEAVTTALTHNTAAAFGLLGGLMGLLLGVAGAMIRQSSRAAVAAGLMGLVLGAAAGAAASMAVVPVYAKYLGQAETQAHAILYASLALGAVWAAIGAAGGMVFGAGMGGWKRATLGLVGGVLGGLLGAAAFELVATVAFPQSGATRPISDSRESRLVARALAALFISAGVALFVAPTRFEEEHEPTPGA